MFKVGIRRTSKHYTHLFALKHVVNVFAVVLSALDARLRRLDVKRMPWQVRVLSDRLGDEQCGVLARRDAITKEMSSQQETRKVGTDSRTVTPERGTCLVGLVALLGSSGPRPSSPEHTRSVKMHHHK